MRARRRVPRSAATPAESAAAIAAARTVMRYNRPMLTRIQQFFERHIADPGAATRSEAERERSYQLATAALLIEMSRADDVVHAVERTAVAQAVRQAFDLDEEGTAELVRLAEAQADQATSLYEFTRLINANFDARQKEHVVELLWHVAYADGELDKYEEHLVRKIADLIYVPHIAFIRAKHHAKTRWEAARGA